MQHILENLSTPVNTNNSIYILMELEGKFEVCTLGTEHLPHLWVVSLFDYR